MSDDLKVAIVYDWIDKWGGVERMLLTMNEIFPQAVFYTSYVDYENAKWAKDLKIKTSFIQKFPSFIKKNRILSLPFYPYAFEAFDFSGYDLVISVSSSFAKSIITKPQTKHICCLLTPARFLWINPELYKQNKLFSFISDPFVEQLKKWDFISAQRPDFYISISDTVRERCKKYYERSSDVIYPPFDVEYWKKVHSSEFVVRSKNLEDKKYFLVVSRLEKYKRVDLVIEAFKEFRDKNLVIIGKGTQEGKLKRMAGENIRFINSVTDEELAGYYKNAEALIMPQEEDFGYVALEAQFFGCPVIAYKKGGSTETIIENKTGIFFDGQSKNSLIKAIERFKPIAYNLKQSVKDTSPGHLKKFEKNNFKKKFLEKINNSFFI